MIPMRGSPDLLKSIQKGAKSVSESRGISSPVEERIPEGGAYNSIRRTQEALSEKINSQVTHTFGNIAPVGQNNTAGFVAYSDTNRVVNKPVSDNVGFNYLTRLYDSLYTLSDTKEYFNAVSSLFSLYAMGKLDDGVFSHMSRDDIREIKGIVREFKSMLDVY